MAIKTLYRNSITGSWDESPTSGSYDESITFDDASVAPQSIACDHPLSKLVDLSYIGSQLSCRCLKCKDKVNLVKQ